MYITRYNTNLNNEIGIKVTNEVMDQDYCLNMCDFEKSECLSAIFKSPDNCRRLNKSYTSLKADENPKLI